MIILYTCNHLATKRHRWTKLLKDQSQFVQRIRKPQKLTKQIFLVCLILLQLRQFGVINLMRTVNNTVLLEIYTFQYFWYALNWLKFIDCL